MTARTTRPSVARAFALAVSAPLMWTTHAAGAQTRGDVAWRARTPWGDPDLHGEWTTEGEYGVPCEPPTQYGTRQFLTDEEYAKRMQDIRVRDEQDLAPVDVLSGRVQGATAPIPHWREYNTTSRRTSLVIDTPAARPPPPPPPHARAPPRPAVRQPARRRAVRLVRRIRPRRPLHRPRRRLSRRDDPGGLQRQHADRAHPGPRPHHLRADSRHADHPDPDAGVGTSSAVAEDPHVHGRRARAVGRDDARRGDAQSRAR